jgi:hypothetical protein
MVDDNEKNDELTDEVTDTAALITRVRNWKVSGEFSDSNGAGVLGYNKAESGDAIGVQGVTDSGSGYGLHTPDDAKVEGVAELDKLGGSLTGGANISDLLGSGLTVDSGTLTATTGVGTYKTHTFTSAETWNALTGLGSETPVEITVDTVGLNNGRVNIEIDGSVVDSETAFTTKHRIFGASSSVTITADELYNASNSIDVSGQASSPMAIGFKDDGTRMFVSGGSTIFQYDLSTPWDVTTASYNSASFTPSGPVNSRGLAFKPDGKKLFVPGDNDRVFQYDLGTAWDITSAGNEQQYSTNLLQTTGIDIKDDGTVLFVGNRTSPKMYSYDLSSPWDVTSAGNRQSHTFSDFSYTGDLRVTNSGQSLYVTDDEGHPDIYEFRLPTPWDISSISTVDSITPTGAPPEVTGVFVRSDTSQIFVTDESNGDVYQYDESGFDGTIYASVQKE